MVEEFPSNVPVLGCIGDLNVNSENARYQGPGRRRVWGGVPGTGVGHR